MCYGIGLPDHGVDHFAPLRMIRLIRQGSRVWFGWQLQARSPPGHELGTVGDELGMVGDELGRAEVRLWGANRWEAIVTNFAPTS